MDTLPQALIDNLCWPCASLFMDDGDTFWVGTAPVVMAAFNMSYEDYRGLTVAEHRAFWQAAAPQQVTAAQLALAALEGEQGG